ncbi:NTP transferase domain-containing protein [Caproicibacter sp.]|uniref:NTP transferase domain-containing protein n=1 Tax=Caproicibacter sp. TaxID=2814884 RepID=UPI003989608F
MTPETIIIQAGGKGTRMDYLTENKPKALVPIRNLPMIFHLFQKYPDRKYVVIGDYKIDVLRKYLNAFCKVDYTIVSATGHTGTCAGIAAALECVPQNTPLMLIWSDLVLPDEFSFPTEEGNYVGLSKDFPCRWKYEDGTFQEERSQKFGVAGFFLFQNKDVLKDVPWEGEFVRWLCEQKISFRDLPLYRTREYGLLEKYLELSLQRCRPFNRLTVEQDCIVKEGIDEQGKMLAIREKAWYEKVRNMHFANIPEIYSLSPLKMEKIDGRNIFEYCLEQKDKKKILADIIACLKSVQQLGSCPANLESYRQAYIGKTFDRLNKVRDLVPFANDETVVINDKTCRNIFYQREAVEKKILQFYPKHFSFIHGDCTFSNILLKNGTTPVLIDPRGYFGYTEFYGDPAYDWAKLYYSVVGNYDQFNLKRFRLHIGEDSVKLEIESNHWEDMEAEFFSLLKNDVSEEQIRLIHAIIWLSLTTYAWENYDSVCGAFYNGLYYLEDIL